MEHNFYQEQPFKTFIQYYQEMTEKLSQLPIVKELNVSNSLYKSDNHILNKGLDLAFFNNTDRVIYNKCEELGVTNGTDLKSQWLNDNMLYEFRDILEYDSDEKSLKFKGEQLFSDTYARFANMPDSVSTVHIMLTSLENSNTLTGNALKTNKSEWNKIYDDFKLKVYIYIPLIMITLIQISLLKKIYHRILLFRTLLRVNKLPQ